MSKEIKLKKLRGILQQKFAGKELVFGSGNEDARIVFGGEAPGRDEEKQGKPFVGRAGRLLDEALNNAGISRKSVYITNVVKFRPMKGNANCAPSKKEVQEFIPFLKKEIEIIKPEIVCTLGSCALFALAGKKEIMKLRGKIIEDEFRILPTIHPSVLVRNLVPKKIFFDDIAKLKKFT